jgi:hypothetical protein
MIAKKDEPYSVAARAVRHLIELTNIQSPILAKTVLFKERTDIIAGPVRGVSNLDWVAGVDALGNDIIRNIVTGGNGWLLAGSAGSGKTQFLNSMLLQLIHKNTPEDLELWMVDPKVDLLPFTKFPHVTKLVSSWEPDEHFITNTAALIEEAFLMMKERHQHLVGLRENHKEDSESSGRLRAPSQLNLPSVIIVIDESSVVFATPITKEERSTQRRIIEMTTELARKGRVAGIHLVLLNNYPTNATLPMEIRNHLAAALFGTNNDIVSQILFSSPSLGSLPKYVGTIHANDDDDDLIPLRSFRVAQSDIDEMASLVANRKV